MVAGAGSDILERIGGIWVSLISSPSTVALVDGQATPAVAFSYPIASFPYAEVTCTIRRGGGHSQKRQSKFTILSDIGGSLQAAEEGVVLGTDIGVVMDATIVGANVEFHYTSITLGTAIEAKFAIKGWS